MKKATLILYLVLSLFPNTVKNANSRISHPSESQIKRILLERDREAFKEKAKDYEEYMFKIAELESAHNPKIVNTLGYIGKYQFGQQALNHLGIDLNVKDFKKNPEIWSEFDQDKAMYDLTQENKRILRREIERYANKELHGIFVTELGLLAGAHASGAQNVKNWIYQGKEFHDAYGTSLTSRIKLFDKGFGESRG
jgi:hypothetical protein